MGYFLLQEIIKFIMKQIPISECKLNKEYVISKILIRDIDLKYKLSKLGFIEKQKVKILKMNFCKVSFLVSVMGVQYGVDRKICDKVMVYDY